jgi:hypothetical protein
MLDCRKERIPQMARNLYTVNGRLVYDLPATPEFQSLTQEQRERIAQLRVGESSVPVGSVRYTRLPDFELNRVCFDRHAKEYVLVTNGECLYDHSSTLAWGKNHSSGRPCEYKASEAIALRPLVENGKVVLAWTYRAVRHEDLQAVQNADEIKETHFNAILQKRRSARFIGRI